LDLCFGLVREFDAGGVVGAVAVGVLLEIVLMEGFGRVELFQRSDLSDDFSVARFGEQLLILGFGSQGDRLLFGGGVEDSAAVVVAPVVALAVLLGGIVKLPERFDEILGGDFGIVVGDFDRFGVVDDPFGGVVAVGEDFVIIRIGVVPPGIARLGVDHAWEVLEMLLHPPEAPGGEDDGLGLGHEA